MVISADRTGTDQAGGRWPPGFPVHGQVEA